MCGIAGVVSAATPGPEREASVHAMVRTLHHRGPDAQRVLTAGEATLGVARLSLVDIAGGHQPMARGPLVLAYNGEVYNHGELRLELERLGERFTTRCDTEVVLAAHARWGDDAPRRFDGMFAYALWSSTERRLLLVRDGLGIKPLYVTLARGRLAFASEPKALVGASPAMDATALCELFLHGAYFAVGSVLGSRSVFAGVEAVEPGHLLEWRAERAARRRWWSLDERIGPAATDLAEGQATLEAAFASSVHGAMMGDADVGTALSGGLDSSLVTADAVRHHPGCLVSSTIRFQPDRAEADPEAAARLSAWLGAKHRLVYADLPLTGYLDDLDATVRAHDAPHMEIRRLGVFANFRALGGEGCKAALNGEGADELFFGYYPRFPGLGPTPLSGPGELAATWRARTAPLRTLLAPAFASGALPREAPDRLIDESVDAWLRPYWHHGQLRAMQCWTLHTFLHWLLADNDRMGMAHSVEGRFPFLTDAMLRASLRLPPEWSLPGQGGFPDKGALRPLGRSRLPEWLWRDRPKAAVPAPPDVRYHLLVADRLEAEVHAAPAAAWRLLARPEVERLLAAFRAGATALARSNPDGGEQLSRFNPTMPRTGHLFLVLTLLRWMTIYNVKL